MSTTLPSYCHQQCQQVLRYQTKQLFIFLRPERTWRQLTNATARFCLGEYFCISSTWSTILSYLLLSNTNFHCGYTATWCLSALTRRASQLLMPTPSILWVTRGKSLYLYNADIIDEIILNPGCRVRCWECLRVAWGKEVKTSFGVITLIVQRNILEHKTICK